MSLIKRILSSIIILILLIMLDSCSSNQTLFVGINGQDGNKGRAEDPITPQKALDLAMAGKCKEIVLLDGTYQVDTTLYLSEAKNLTIRALHPGKVIITAGRRVNPVPTGELNGYPIHDAPHNAILFSGNDHCIEHNHPPWSERFPWLKEIAKDDPEVPKHNIIKGNRVVNSAAPEIHPAVVEFGEVGLNPEIH